MPKFSSVEHKCYSLLLLLLFDIVVVVVASIAAAVVVVARVACFLLAKVAN